MADEQGMTLRPFRLMCAVCALGAADGCSADPHSREILAAIREHPDQPVTLHCNAGDVYVYQEPGTADDTPEGVEFNRLRDLEILHKLNLFPGATLPARILIYRLLAQIADVTDLCGYDAVTGAAWAGCPRAGSGAYPRGHALGIDAIIPPRPAPELCAEKANSLAAMAQASATRVRPHMLLCAVCQYGSGVRPPYPEDNLPELIASMLQAPETPIMLAPGAEWMMCAPCPYCAPELPACVNNRGSGGLPNQLRDLRVLRQLGMQYGDVLPARDLFLRIFTRISGTLAICRLDHAYPSVWYTGCGAATADSEAYTEGKKRLLAALA